MGNIPDYVQSNVEAITRIVNSRLSDWNQLPARKLLEKLFESELPESNVAMKVSLEQFNRTLSMYFPINMWSDFYFENGTVIFRAYNRIMEYLSTYPDIQLEYPFDPINVQDLIHIKMYSGSVHKNFDIIGNRIFFTFDTTKPYESFFYNNFSSDVAHNFQYEGTSPGNIHKLSIHVNVFGETMRWYRESIPYPFPETNNSLGYPDNIIHSKMMSFLQHNYPQTFFEKPDTIEFRCAYPRNDPFLVSISYRNEHNTRYRVIETVPEYVKLWNRKFTPLIRQHIYEALPKMPLVLQQIIQEYLRKCVYRM